MAATNKGFLLTEQNLKNAFRMLDQDSSGYITLREFKLLFGTLNLSENIWMKMIETVDDNSDGKVSFIPILKISFEEFSNMMYAMRL
jgi:Ca2+-binding EF-hand superfamily protein